MALKEQANKKKTPRNKNDKFRDGKPLEKMYMETEPPEKVNLFEDEENDYR